MNRKEIMEGCPEGFEDDLKDIVDYFEGTFVEIREQLNISGIDQISQIEDAYEMAKRIADDLY